MEGNNYRGFVDAVYGHIYIRKDYCREIVDTVLFQRLKRIEQTSMRPIFPSAHHDRFSHSLGTYHIGCIIFQHLKNNTSTERVLFGQIKDVVPELYKKTCKDSDFWSLIQPTYELACLLHDCGHAPFSHTFEDFYLQRNCEEGVLPPIKQDIINAYTETIQYINREDGSALGRQAIRNLADEFRTDFLNCSPKPHEMVSAWLVLHEKGFRNRVHKLGGDPLLIARMIMGCTYSEGCAFEEKIYNCFIGLLNGGEIDADRTDYAIRDKWAAGLNTATINIERLFSSIHIFHGAPDCNPNYPIVCYSKNALPELESILEIKNYNYFWIFNHHKLLYHERVLRKAVEKLALLFNGRNAIESYLEQKEQTTGEHEMKADGVENNALYQFFDYHNLIEPQKYEIDINGTSYIESLFLLCDDDIVHLLKKFFCSQISVQDGYLHKFYSRNNYAEEWFSRRHHLIPLWKSYVEFSNKFLKFHHELISIKLLIDKTEKHPISERKKLPDIEKILSDAQLRECTNNLERLHGKDNYTIARLLKNCLEGDNVRYAEWISQLKLALTDYQFHRDDDIRTAIGKAISELNQDGFIPNPPIYKFINTDRFAMRSIAKNSIFIDMKNNTIDKKDNNRVVDYTDLDLPIKNAYKEYEFFYVYLPWLTNDQNLDKKQCREKYTITVRKAIEQIIH